MTQRAKNILLVLALCVGFTVMSLFSRGNGIGLDFGEDSLTVTGPEKYQFTIAYSRISVLELVELTDAGEPAAGEENKNYRWGSWSNEAWQDYSLCAAKKADQCILIAAEDGSCFVFNYLDDATTQQVYSMFSELLAHYSEREAGDNG